MGQVLAVCLHGSPTRRKRNIGQAALAMRFGMSTDAHANHPWDQIHILPADAIRQCTGEDYVDYGSNGEHLVVDSLPEGLTIGTNLRCGDAALEVTALGADCPGRCGDTSQCDGCLMRRCGVICKVRVAGIVTTGDPISD